MVKNRVLRNALYLSAGSTYILLKWRPINDYKKTNHMIMEELKVQPSVPILLRSEQCQS